MDFLDELDFALALLDLARLELEATLILELDLSLLLLDSAELELDFAELLQEFDELLNVANLKYAMKVLDSLTT